MARTFITSDVVLDISHWQGAVDFRRVKDFGIQAVFIKASQGSHSQDPLWHHNSYWAGQAGLLFAPYHFITDDDPVAQFDRIMHAANPGEGAFVMLDWENDTPVETVIALGDLVENATGRRPLMYCGRYQLTKPDATLSAWPLMLPEYGTDPVCPPGWPSWLFHQYTEKGLVDGVAGHVDRSVFAGTQDELAEWWLTGTLPASVLPLEPAAQKPKQKFTKQNPDNSAADLNRKELEKLNG